MKGQLARACVRMHLLMTMALISSEPFLLCGFVLAWAFWLVVSWHTEETEVVQPRPLGFGVANSELSTSLSFAKVWYLQRDAHQQPGRQLICS